MLDSFNEKRIFQSDFSDKALLMNCHSRRGLLCPFSPEEELEELQWNYLESLTCELAVWEAQ